MLGNELVMLRTMILRSGIVYVNYGFYNLIIEFHYPLPLGNFQLAERDIYLWKYFCMAMKTIMQNVSA